MRAKEAGRGFKAVINDVRAGDELLLSLDGPPNAVIKCEYVKIELQYFMKIAEK